ncbi:MAG: hypothetical protein BM556_10020 [Bacteriovorax sp. MedPE-SWde]|nr:MAG: hypothetical protein BM556_10020 [Bacteriovorax sp. MedPE-SWde]
MKMSKVENKKNFAYTAIFALSFVIVLFLVWFIYFKPASTAIYDWVEYLPFVNAGLNSLCATFLVLGYYFVKVKKVELHIKCMSSATVTSGLFLVSYLLYHHYHGDTKFIGQGLIRPTYFFILITHIILSVAMVPMVFITLWNAFTNKVEKHKKWARVTLPVWLYVSVTGVLIVAILKNFNY